MSSPFSSWIICTFEKCFYFLDRSPLPDMWVRSFAMCNVVYFISYSIIYRAKVSIFDEIQFLDSVLS
jgi:hypothetical protein